VHPSIEALNRLANDALENPPVRGAEEDSLTMITSHRDVIETTGHMKTQRTRHPCLPFDPESPLALLKKASRNSAITGHFHQIHECTTRHREVKRKRRNSIGCVMRARQVREYTQTCRDSDD
jgi:hypothetical protein